MTLFYLKTVGEDIYALDSTESFNFEEGGSLTEYTIESGAKASDHYVNENKTFNLSGVITDFKTKASVNQRLSEDFIGGLLKIKQEKTPLTLYFREQSSNALDNYFKDLMIVSISFSQDQSTGYSLGRYAYKVSIQLKQIVFSERATVTQENVITTKATPKKEATAAPTVVEGSTTTPPSGVTATPEEQERYKYLNENVKGVQRKTYYTPL